MRESDKGSMNIEYEFMSYEWIEEAYINFIPEDDSSI